MTRTESAASIKRRSPHKGERSRQLPREGSQLRAFYDSLQHAARHGAFLPASLYPDHSRVSSMINYLHSFYGLDIVTIRPKPGRRGHGPNIVVGWYISGEWQGHEYVRYPIPGLDP